MKTVIMAGGYGTRISGLFPDVPKPLIPISGKPVLEWEICSLRDQGFRDFILTVGYMADKIMSYFGDGRELGVRIQYYIEEKPLGNAGALFKIKDQLESDFLLLIADAMFDVDFNRMVEYHQSKEALVTLFTHPNNHPYDSSLLVTDENKAVTAWLTKEDLRPQWYKNRVNAGLQIIHPKVLDMIGIDPDRVGQEDENGKIQRVDMDRQILKPLCGSGRMFCYDSPEYCIDMGNPERFAQVSKDFESGLIQKKRLKNRQKAIFLDRDGTINKHIGFLRDLEEFELLPEVAEAIKLINNSGYLAIVITNQPVIARGEITVEQLNAIHDKMETLLGYEGAYLDGLYYCPHHPDKGFTGEVPELKIECCCRKPKPGLFFRAAADYNINLEQSWMIGDSENDIKAGKAAGCKTALIGEGGYGQDISDASLYELVKIILDQDKQIEFGKGQK